MSGKVRADDNLQMTIENGKLTIVMVCDLENVVEEPSTSGKSRLVATTRGNITVPGTGLKLGLNLYQPIKTVE